jgi:hypothetical protein
MKKRFVFLLICLFILGIKIQGQYILLSENFESGTLNPLITFNKTGVFSSLPGIKDVSSFGSAKGFGFGISTCSANCFESYVTELIITFPMSTYIDSMLYCEMELYGNWGSKGDIYINGSVLPNSYIGNIPSNDRSPDVTPRCKSFIINQQVNTITFHVWDITNSSEIFIDNLFLYGPVATGIFDINNSPDKISIYPNPSNGSFVITTLKVVPKGSLEIFNSFGERIFNRKVLDESKINIMLSNASAGVYLVKLSDGENTYNQKIIIF